MGKVKTGLTVVLALALLVTGAFIPRLVCRIQDEKNSEAPAFAPMPSVRLDMKERATIVDRLFMMAKVDGYIRIDESKAKHSGEEILTLVQQAIEPYVTIPIMDYRDDRIKLYPSLAKVDDAPELQGIVWFVTFSGEGKEGYSFLDLIVDDETGKVLVISYTQEAETEKWLSAQETMEVFAELYFTNMGISEYREYQNGEMTHAYVDGESNGWRFSFGDITYGQVDVDLYVHEYGFYAEISETPTAGAWGAVAPIG